MIEETQKSLQKSEFVAWKNEQATKFIFEYLREVYDFHKEELASRDLICSPNGQLRLNYLRGYIDAIEDILNIYPVSDEEEGSNED